MKLLLPLLVGCGTTTGEQGADGAIGPTGAQGPQGEQGPAGAPGTDGADGLPGVAGVSSRTVFTVATAADGTDCYTAIGDGSPPTLVASCCPAGFELAGAWSGEVVCVEAEPARARVVLALTANLGLWCDEVPGQDCCAPGYTFVGDGTAGGLGGYVLCLQD